VAELTGTQGRYPHIQYFNGDSRRQTGDQDKFTEWTPDGHLRHSKFVGLREDKEAREVVREG
jgi:hypothetical protein